MSWGGGGRLPRKHAKVIIFLTWDKTGQSEARHVCVHWPDTGTGLRPLAWRGSERGQTRAGTPQSVNKNKKIWGSLFVGTPSFARCHFRARESRFSGSLPSNGSCNGCCPHQNHNVPRHKNNRYINRLTISPALGKDSVVKYWKQGWLTKRKGVLELQVADIKRHVNV